MIHDNVELHNVGELVKMPDGGLRLQRVPEAVREKLGQASSGQYLSQANTEIRFVADGLAKVTLSAPDGGSGVQVFHGTFQSTQRFSLGEPQTIELVLPEALRKLPSNLTEGLAFSPRVFRLAMSWNTVHFHGAEGEGIRPPQPGEVPRLRYLAYGTSITHGAHATGSHLGYAAQTARRLGADLINLGVAGACHCEPALADYIAARDDWDFATLALSVNMVGPFTTDEFRRRVRYMVHTVAAANPQRPVACITIFPHLRDFGPQFALPEDKGDTEACRRELRAAVADCPRGNVHLIEGSEILADIDGLGPDLVHPSDSGMIQMGENLARRLEPIVKPLR